MFNESIVLSAIDIIKKQNYASLRSLFRRLKDSSNIKKEEEFYHKLQDECSTANSVIGEIDEKNANNAILQPRVFYSKDWEKNIPWPQGIGQKIGFDLYRFIITKDMIVNNGGKKVGTALLGPLEGQNYDHVIAAKVQFNGVQCYDYEYCWGEFSKYYKKLEKDCEKIDIDKEYKSAVKKLNNELVTGLSSRFLNERFTGDVAVGGQIIVLGGHKLTKAVLKKIASNVKNEIHSDNGQLIELISQFRRRFFELEKRYKSIKNYLQRLRMLPQPDW